MVTVDDDCSHEIKRLLLLGRNYDKLRQHIQKQRYHFANKGPYSQSNGFSVVMNRCESWSIKKIWALKNRTVVLEKTLESLLDSKIKPVNPKRNQSWIFIGRTDAETLILWPPDVKSWLTGNDPDVGKDWRQKEKGVVEDEMVRWHHQLTNMNLSKLWEIVEDRGAWHTAIHGVTKSQRWLSDWKITNKWKSTFY